MGISSLAVMANSLTLHLHRPAEVPLESPSSQKSSLPELKSWKHRQAEFRLPSLFWIQQKAGRTILWPGRKDNDLREWYPTLVVGLQGFPLHCWMTLKEFRLTLIFIGKFPCFWNECLGRLQLHWKFWILGLLNLLGVPLGCMDLIVELTDNCFELEEQNLARCIQCSSHTGV